MYTATVAISGPPRGGVAVGTSCWRDLALSLVLDGLSQKMHKSTYLPTHLPTHNKSGCGGMVVFLFVKILLLTNIYLRETRSWKTYDG